VLLANADDERVMARAARTRARVITYGFEAGADLRAVDIEPGPTGCGFTLERDGMQLGRVDSPLAGRHNVWNTLAAYGVAFELGVDFAALNRVLPGFLGTKKRQEERGEVNGVLVIDDYAHHPTAIRETLAALRARYPDRRLWGVYEPKSNTARRNIHQEAYATAFDAADLVVFAKPYQKNDGLASSEMLDVDALVGEISSRGTPATYRPDVPAILAHLVDETAPGDLVVVMANSGFGGLIDKLLTAL